MHRFRVLPILSGGIYVFVGVMLVRAHVLAQEAPVLRFAFAGRAVELPVVAVGTALLGLGAALIGAALLARAPRDLPVGEGRGRYVDAATRLPVHYFAQGPREWLWNRFVARLWLQFALLAGSFLVLQAYLDR